MSCPPEIETVIQRYFDGIYTGNLASLRAAFHPTAQLFGTVRGQPYHKTLEAYLAIVAARQSPQALGEARRMTVLTVDVQGPIATARAHCVMLGNNYIDHLSLCLIDGRWQIVNKLFTHVD